VVLFCGPSGSQKSTVVACLTRSGYFGSSYVLPDKASGPWFDDYDGQSTLVIDEMDGNRMRPTFFNTLNDKNECNAPCHGMGGVQIVSKHHFILSNYFPQTWWKSHRSASKSLQTRRRIHAIWYSFRKSDTPMPPLTINGGVAYCIVPGRGAVPLDQYEHPFDARHRSYTPHYHAKRRIFPPNYSFVNEPFNGLVWLCWNCLYDPVTNVCGSLERLK